MIHFFIAYARKDPSCLELKIRRGNRGNEGIIFYIFPKNLCCVSLESSYQDGSNEASHHMFSLRHKKNYPQYPVLSGALLMPGQTKNIYLCPVCFALPLSNTMDIILVFLLEDIKEDWFCN